MLCSNGRLPWSVQVSDSILGGRRTFPLTPEELALLVELFSGRAQANGESTRFLLTGCEARLTVPGEGGFTATVALLDVGVREIGLAPGAHQIAPNTPIQVELAHPALRHFRWECRAGTTGPGSQGVSRLAARFEPPAALPRR